MAKGDEFPAQDQPKQNPPLTPPPRTPYSTDMTEAIHVGDHVTWQRGHGHITQIARGFYIAKTTDGHHTALRATEITKEAPP